MMDSFDIMTTATLRPDLIKKTFDSFIENLFGDHIKKANLIINIDMVGSKTPQKTLQTIIDYIDSIPFESITLQSQDNPSFSHAYCWCLSKLKHNYTFILEEDWELTMPFKFENMIRIFEQDKSNLVHLRLSFHTADGEGFMKCWNKFIPWNGKFYEVPFNLRGTIGFAGHPSLNKTAFLKWCLPRLDPEKNPEKQIKGNSPGILSANYGVYHPLEFTGPALVDLGRKWMQQHGYQKKGIKAFFTEWEEVK